MLSITNLQFAYSSQKTFTLQIDKLTIKDNEYIYIIGPSGSGKSTLAKIISGLLSPSSGNISFTTDLRVIYLSQDLGLWNHMTVKEHINFVLNRCCRKKQHYETEKFLQLFDLMPYQNYRPNDLSGGYQQRLALARAMASKPNLLILDEPFSSIDPVNAQNLSTVIQDIYQSQELSILEVSHYLFHFKSDYRILIVENGKIDVFNSIHDLDDSTEWRKQFKKLIQENH